MEKRQKEGLKALELEINRLFEKMDRREFMMAKAEMEGDAEMIEKCKAARNNYEQKLAGIDFALNYIGYRREYDSKNDREVLVQF